MTLIKRHLREMLVGFLKRHLSEFNLQHVTTETWAYSYLGQSTFGKYNDI